MPTLPRADPPAAGLAERELAAIIAAAWDRLVAAVDDRTSPLRTPVVATGLPGGGAAARVMVLRSVYRAAGCLIFFTDSRAAKCGELPGPVAVTAYDSERSIQLRLSGRARLADAAATRAAWTTVPAVARAAYRTANPPGTPAATPALAGAHLLDAAADFFAVIAVTVTHIDVLDLAATPHRRAGFTVTDGWAGSWLTP